MKRNFILLFIALFCLVVGGCKSTPDLPDTSQLYKNETETQIYQGGLKSMMKGNYDEAANRFETIESRYPFGPYARQAQLNLIYTYYKQDDNVSVLAACDQYLHLYPRGPNADYVYYMKGMAEMNINHGFFEKFVKTDYSQRDLENLNQTFDSFDRVVRWFPDSVYAPDARQRIIYIRNTLARHVLQVAQYYFDNTSYVASVNRCSEIIKHYQQTTVVPDALVLLYKSYQKLGLTQSADQTLQVIQLNYPNIKLK